MSGDQNQQNQQNQNKQKGGGGGGAQVGITLNRNMQAGNNLRDTVHTVVSEAVGYIAAAVVTTVVYEAMKQCFGGFFSGGSSSKPALPSPGQAAYALSNGDPNQIKALIARNPKLLDAAREAVAQQEQQTSGNPAPVQEAVTQPVNTPPAQPDQPKPDKEQSSKGNSGKGDKNK